MKTVARAAKWIGLGAVLVVAIAAATFAWRLAGSRPTLEGEIAAAALAGPVTVERDAAGVPTITATTRPDAAYALGYLHGQERFFQMDTLRRRAAGELSAMMGGVTEKIDMAVVPHRFRERARAIAASASPEERAALDAYVRGVNQGLGDLGTAPFEYLLLRGRPEPWTAEDSILATFAMYLDLQPSLPNLELDRARAERRGGRALADLLYPVATEIDAPIDGSAAPALPALPPRLAPQTAPAPIARAASPDLDPVLPGSNNWAVAGRLSTSGGALVADDMHLGINAPGIWYRARVVVKPAGAAGSTVDMTGVTLPGQPTVIAGSNGKIAWGFTNSYIDTFDAVVVEPVAGRPDLYRTPQGPRPIQKIGQRFCVKDECRTETVEETIWGPIVATDAFGRKIAMRWVAHDRDAVKLEPMLALERAGSVADAIAIAHRGAIPNQNFTVGDAAGNIGWTVVGRIPDRFGFDGRDATSWADGTRGWRGWLSPDRTPTVVNPASGRIWTANGRVVGGEALRSLGDGGYADGNRAGRIRDLLFAKERFGPKDFLAIQLDTANPREEFWQALMLAELRKRRGDPRLAAMIAPVERWGGRAEIESIGYRLVISFRSAAIERAYGAYMGELPEGRRRWAPGQAEGAMRALLRARSPGLAPPGDASWDAFLTAALTIVADDVDKLAGGDAGRFTWGDYNKAGVRHPLSAAVPGLGWLTDPQDRALPGGGSVVRAQGPGFGASERFAVSPGREAEGIFHMPSGQAGNPWTPYHLAGHEDWLEGRPAPFLPGPTKWVLKLEPGASR